MNLEDSVRRSNSWHWLFAVAALSAVSSVFMPSYGWKDALAYRKTSLEPRVGDARSKSDALKALDEAEAIAADRKSADLKAKTAKLRADFAAYGLAPVPEGDGAVFAAQSRISEALAKRRIRIVSNEASVAGETPSPVTAAGANGRGAVPSDRQSSAKPQMTAAEYRRQVDAQAAKMTDRKLREMFLADARRQIARMEAAEKNNGVQGRAVAPRPQTSGMTDGAERRPYQADTQKRVSPASAAVPSFKTSEIDYKVVGDFRDVFMFFAAETHKKPNYAFRDITVRRGESGMDVSFTLRVQHK